MVTVLCYFIVQKSLVQKNGQKLLSVLVRFFDKKGFYWAWQIVLQHQKNNLLHSKISFKLTSFSFLALLLVSVFSLPFVSGVSVEIVRVS